ncbi:MAG: hypothetical protein AAF734_10975 [Bacteroidota bacterium]
MRKDYINRICLNIFTCGTQAQWTQQGTGIDGEDNNDNAGFSVSLSSDGAVLAIGAINNDGVAQDASGTSLCLEWYSGSLS